MRKTVRAHFFSSLFFPYRLPSVMVGSGWVGGVGEWAIRRGGDG
jgi:hypothetical protein